ncbi:MAG TPA: hypothetical protein VGF77_16945 [Allosphingosinicella sp.]
MDSRKGPEAYIRSAAESIGLCVESVQVSRYSPDAFGNFVGTLETGFGTIAILYDRGFGVEGLPDADSAELIEALERQKRNAGM